MKFAVKIFFLVILLKANTAFSQDIDTAIAISEKLSPTTAAPREGVSPKPGWGDFEVVEEREETTSWEKILLWIPNRFLDFIDIFRVDVGAGPSFGAVARITKYGQVGYRTMSPASLRIGDLGRDYPFMMERSSEFGIGPLFVKSKDRDVCTGEIGVGADVLLVGAYAGICVEEIADFFAGLFFLDIMDDDLE